MVSLSRIPPVTNWCVILWCTVLLQLDASPVSTATVFLGQQLHQQPSAAVGHSEDEPWTPDQVSKEMASSFPPTAAAIFTEEDGRAFVSRVRREKFVSLEDGCGRGKNRLATLSDGTKLCCRYRDLQWREIRGEFYSYYLNNYLGMFNAPPAALVRVNFSSPQWAGVQRSAVEAGWSDHTTIVVSLYVEDLTQETFPAILADDGKSIVTEEHLKRADRSRILQWSDMIVFDFIIGHSDRIFNALFNLQWNSQMLRRPVHNLLKTKQSHRLLLFDNESGFWLGYRMGQQDPFKYELQERYLKRLCIFRSQTIKHVESLLLPGETSAFKKLEKYIDVVDSVSLQMVNKPLSADQRKEFESRLRLVVKQVKSCV